MSDEKDQINPSHYQQYRVQAIDMMEAMWGTDSAARFCEMTAFKYRMRLGLKDNIEQELKKEAWYLEKAEELRNKKKKIKGIM